LPRRATLSDVARLAGVSATTASYILNGRSAQMRIAPATEERVRQAATTLHYRPNPNARRLRTSTSRTIGVISDLVAGGQFASQMLTGASTAARALDHLIVIGESQGDPEHEALLIESMLDRGVDGIVYTTMVTVEISAPAMLRQQKVVLLNCVDRETAFPAVVPDEYQGGRSAALEVLVGGCQSGIFVVGEQSSGGAIASRLRLDGIRDGLQSGGCGLDGILECEWSVSSAYRAVDEFLATGGGPRALICFNDRAAMGAYQALAEHRLRVPQDVSIVSFDGSELARWLRPELTSVVLPYAELGARAVEILLDPGEKGAGVVRIPMPVHRGMSVSQSADV
jgi:LacI family transcriptional regulator